ncbi:glycosyltransferase [Pedobacter changchengzhani]|uniref:Glycosyltransferase n=1 Tax=Pedobacter changchengzhani TaxID=2529274 RepID=A0A4R5MQW7_9SPHI|nr:glycosyltransferase [Pedobacter changchengzhani]TDG37719.1 glycosyltransferase [Pedobacter changchengzhani]
MILIDALYINMGGGKVLLDYLITKLDQSNKNIHFLLDDRIKDAHPTIQNNKVTYLRAKFTNRHQFYRLNASQFTKVLCFASLPPSMRLKAKVYTYFHQLLYLKVPKNSGFKFTIIAAIKSLISKTLKSNTDFWVVQSASVKNQLVAKYNIKAEEVKVIPFYPPVVNCETVVRMRETYAYVSLPATYKNHERLIEAFCLFHQKTGRGELNITVNDEFPLLLAQIELLKLKKIPIINHGFLGKEKLNNLYQSVEYVIFPSLAESFGLGIIEALENGCKIIGADLPYMRAVCEPSISFNPTSINDMVLAFEKSIFEEPIISKQLVHDEVDKLVRLLN